MSHPTDADFAEWNEETCRRYTEAMRKNVKYDHRPWARRIAEHLGDLPAGATVADVATGPGFLLIELGKLLDAPRLIALDAAAPMLAIARQEAEREGLELTTFQCPAEQLSLEDATADVVTCKQLLHEASNVERTLAEMARVLKPGGRAFVIDFDSESSRWRPWLVKQLIRVRFGEYMAGRFWHSYSHGLPGSTMSERMRAAGFARAECLPYGMNYFLIGHKQ